jgi:hypothetical protein
MNYCSRQATDELLYKTGVTPATGYCLASAFQLKPPPAFWCKQERESECTQERESVCTQERKNECTQEREKERERERERGEERGDGDFLRRSASAHAARAHQLNRHDELNTAFDEDDRGAREREANGGASGREASAREPSRERACSSSRTARCSLYLLY